MQVLNIGILQYSNIQISIKTGAGLDELLQKLTEKIAEKYAVTDSPTITRTRHRHALEQALQLLVKGGAQFMLGAIQHLVQEALTRLDRLFA